jgi:glycosyltransferase 2 family protein
MSRSSLFVSRTDQPKARRAGDVVLLVSGVILLGLDALFAAQRSDVDAAAGNVFSSLPSWMDEVFSVGYTLAALFAIWIVVMSLIRKRWDIAGSIVLSVTVTVAVALVLARAISGDWPIVLPELGASQATPVFPVMRVAIVSSVVFAASPHLPRVIRWLGWFTVGLVVISGLGLGFGLPSDALGGVGIGIAAAGGVLLLFGSPAAYPDIEEIASQLSTLDVDLRDLRPAPVQPWGARSLDGVDSDGRRLVVKVYGADARDAQMLARVWRSLWYRDTGPSVPWSRLQQVEHEALVTVLAAGAGVNCPTVVVAATSEDDDAILVTEQRGVPLGDMDPDELTDQQLVAVWREVATLHGADMSHGALDASHVGIEGDRAVITDFQVGSLSATNASISVDVAELLVAISMVVGVDRAISSARVGLGDDALVAAVPYLQLPALRSTTRRSIDKAGKFVKELRSAVIEATGIDKPEPVKLRRIRIQDIVVTILVVLLAAFLLQQLVAVDWQEVWQTIQSADPAWLIAALVVAQFILLPNATSLMSVVRAPLPLRPTMILQSAIQFVGVAVPSAAGRIATNVAYLRKFGLSPTAAITQGALDSFTMFIVQVVILVVAFLFGDVNFGFSAPSGGDNWGVILLIVIGVVIAGIIVMFTVKKVRDQVFQVAGQVREALSVLVEEPKRAVFVFSSNFATELLLGMAMWFSVIAIGEQISLGASLAVVVGAVMLGGLAPTPGGVGVQEAVLAAGLVGVGVSPNDATAAAIIYRIVTFALPPFWGAASLGWLRRNDYV